MARILPLVLLLAALAVALVATAKPAAADGILVPCPLIEPGPGPEIAPPPCPTPFPPIKYHRVQAEIHDQVAQVHVDQAFENTGDTPLEATYMFPLPPDAAVSDFTMTVDGQQLEGRLLDRDEARAIYESFVRRQRDPALLEYIDRGVFQASIFPIPPHQERRIQISYTQVLTRENGLVRFAYPLATEKFSPQPIPDVSVTVDVVSTAPIRSVYSPSHDVAVERPDDNHATASLELSDATPQSDFELLYSTSDQDVGLNLLTYRTGSDAGYFLLLAAPKVEADPGQVESRDVALVLDTSGSMTGEKLAQAKQALRYVVDHLHDDDRVAVIAFDSTVRSAYSGLRPASEARADATKFIDGLDAGGSTNIDDALLAAFDALSGGERQSLVIFMTDGQPTVGVTDPAEIAGDARRAAPHGVRLFTFGVGNDVNAPLLDQLAQEHAGVSEYVHPDQDAGAAVSRFFERISDPVLTDLKLDFGDVDVSDVFPNPLPDLFAGSQLVVAGRYQGSGTVDVTLTGSINGRQKQYTFEGQSFPSNTTSDGFVPRLWATRKIGFLLNSIRLDTRPSDEVVQEIVALSKKFGIITPYTSFLVEEPQLSAGDATYRFEQRSLPQLSPTMGAAQSGAAAVGAAEKAAGLANAQSVDAAGSAGQGQMRLVGGRPFVLNGNVWTDSAYDGTATTTKIGFDTAGYYDALSGRPDWGAYFALGERVIFVSDGRAWEIASGDFPAVDVPAAPAEPRTDTQPVVTDNQPDIIPQPGGHGSSLPWAAAGGGAGAALLLLGAAWLASRRRRQRAPGE